jgi:CBS domain-containing protein
MKARDMMTKNPTTVTPDTKLQEAARMMKDRNVGILPVVAETSSQTLVGVITDRDIAIRCVAQGHDSSKCLVREVMSTGVVTAREDDDVDSVMELMGREQVRRIPIVGERGSLVGIVAQADVVIEAQDDKKAEKTVERISKESAKHSQ